MAHVQVLSTYPPQVDQERISREAYEKWNAKHSAMKSPNLPYGAINGAMIEPNIEFEIDMGQVIRDIADGGGIDTSTYDEPETTIPAGKGVKGLPPVRRGKGIKQPRRGKGIKQPRRGKGVKCPPIHRGKGLQARKMGQATTRRKKLNKRRNRKPLEDKELLTPKEVRSQLPDGIDIISIKTWHDEIKNDIECGGEDYAGTGKPKIQIFKRRANTKGKGEFRVYKDGTLAFIYDDAPPGMTLERTRVVLLAEPSEDGRVVSINTFANAYNIPCGNTGQKNGKEFFFSKNWRDNDNYHIYACIMGEEIQVEEEEESNSSSSFSEEEEDSF